MDRVSEWTGSWQTINVAVGWQLYECSGDPWSLGLVGVVELAPVLFHGRRGTAADRYPRRDAAWRGTRSPSSTWAPPTALSVNAPPRTYYARLIAFNAYGHAFSEERALSVALNAFTGTSQPFDAQSFDITLLSTGTYEGTLRWEDASIDLDLYMATTACGYPPTGCVLAVSDQSSGNTEQVSLPVAAGSSYRLWIDNFTDRTTSFTITNVVG